MASETPKLTKSETKPWDLGSPGFTYTTKMAKTFVRFLQEADSVRYEIAYADPYQMGVRLLGPNANEIIFRAQREYNQGAYMTTRDDAMLVVDAMRKHPKKMNQKHRERLAAQVALFLALEARVR